LHKLKAAGRYLLSWLAWSYLALVGALCLILFIGGDRWWPATVLLFSPRWLALLPLILLTPIAVWLNSGCLIPLLIAAVVVAGPFMGLRTGIAPQSGNATSVIRIITCNIEAGSFDAGALSRLIQETRADIVALQECPRDIRQNLKLSKAWHGVEEGGLAIFSRYPLKQSITLKSMHPPHKWPRTSLLGCTVASPGGELAFHTLHLPSPRNGLQNILDRATIFNLSRTGMLERETAVRLQTAGQARRVIAAQTLPVIIAGDFNMPVESSIYRETWSGYANAFSSAGRGYGLTEFASIRGFGIGVRIDHVLSSNGLKVQLCETGPDVGSDHLPVIADIGWHR